MYCTTNPGRRFEIGGVIQNQASFSALDENEACHGVARGEAGPARARQKLAENFALASRTISSTATHRCLSEQSNLASGTIQIWVRSLVALD